MKLPAFDYRRPQSLAEAIDVLSRDAGAAALAGGQTLLASMALGSSQPSTLVDLEGIGGLGGMQVDGEGVSVGAMVRHRAVETHPELRARCPAIAEAVGLIGNICVRNRGTVGGGVAVADPAGEWPCLLVALDATALVAGPTRARRIAAADLFSRPFRASLGPGELIIEVRLRLPRRGVPTGSAFHELSLRHAYRAVVAAAAVLEANPDGRIARARLVLANAGPMPVRATVAETAIVGEIPSDELFADAAAAVRHEVDPPGDETFTAGYRRHVAGVLAERALRAARDRLTEARAG